MLLDHGADVNILDNYGTSPLHVAAVTNVDIFGLLLTSRPDIDINLKRKLTKLTPLHLIADMGNTECAKLLLSKEEINVNPKGTNVYKNIL